MKLRNALLTAALSFGTASLHAQGNWSWLYDSGRHCTPCIEENWKRVFPENSGQGHAAKASIEENKSRIIAAQTDEERRSHEGVLRLAEDDIVSDKIFSDIDEAAKRVLRNRPTILDKLLDDFKDNAAARMNVYEYGIEFNTLIPVPGVHDRVGVRYKETREHRYLTFRVDGQRNEEYFDTELKDDSTLGILSAAYTGLGNDGREARDNLLEKKKAGEKDMSFDNTEIFEKINAAIDARYNARRETEQQQIKAMQSMGDALRSLEQDVPQSLSDIFAATATSIEETIPKLRSYSEDPLGLHK